MLTVADNLTEAFLNRRNKHRQGPVFASHLNTSEEWRIFLRLLAERCDEAMPVGESVNGATDERAVSGNFSGLYSLAGYVPSTKGFPMVDNSGLRADLHLNSGWDAPDDRALFRAISSSMFRKVPLVPYRINRRSSTMFPHWTTDVQGRTAHLYEMFARVREVADLAERRDIVALWNLGLVDVASTVSRLQPDKLKKDESGLYRAKVRMVPSEEYGLSGGKKGSLVEMDKTTDFEGFYTMRERQAYGMSGIFNAFIQSLFSAWRADYSKRFEFTFVQRGLSSLSSKVQNFDGSVCCDAVQYDSTLPFFMFDEFVDSLPVDDWLKWLIRRVGTADVLYGACVRDVKSSGFTGGDSPSPRPFDKDYWGGLLSGVCFVSDFGKLVGTFLGIKTLRAAGVNIADKDVPLFLRGEMSHALLCAGDNLMFLGPDKTLSKIIDSLKKDSPLQRYVGLSLENDFCGYVLSRSNRMSAHPSVVSYVVNPFAKEHLITSPRASDWRLGFVLRQQVFASAPCYPIAREIIGRTYKDVFLRAIESEVGPLDVPPTFGPADLTYITKPDVIHYLLREEDVSKELLDKDSVVVTVPDECHGVFFT